MRIFKCYLILGCVLLGSQFAAASDPQWVEVRSPNFSVITDAGEKKGRDVALHFEQMRSVFGTLMTKANVNLAVPLQIVAFHNTKEMRQMAPIFNSKPTEVAGLFQGGEDRSFIMLDMSVEDPWTVVFHEYAHQLMDGNLSFRTDPWFEEGFAEYFSSIEVDSKEARVGKIPALTYQILQQMGMMKVSDLFRVQQNSKTYNESGDHRTTFYAESGLVVHYLYDDMMIPKLTVYFDALRGQKKTVEQSVQAAFGMTADEFDKVLRDYFRSGRFRYHPIPTPTGIVAAQFTVAAVSAVDARALLADIHAHSPDYRDKAIAEFQDVLKTDPDNATALRGVGFAYLQQRQFAQAAEYLRRAAQRDAKDPRVHLYYAMLLNQQGPPTGEVAGEIKKELETAVALDPKLADAYSLLGYTQAASGEPEKGLASMKRAVELSPRNDRYLFNLANVYIANRQVDTAIALLHGLENSADPEVAAQAKQTLEQALHFKEQLASIALRKANRQIEWRQAPDEREDGKERESTPAHEEIVQLPPGTPVHFLKGKLVAVDCSVPPQAVLIVAAGSRSLKIHVRNSDQMVLIGADEFSCDWKNKNVAVNYRERPDGEGDAVSVEMQ